MAYSDNERNSLTPIEGYEFTYGDETWRVTPSYRRRYIGGLLFEPMAMQRAGLQSGPEVSSDELEITIRTSHPVVTAFRNSDKLNPFHVTVYRGHIGGSSSDYAIVFRGTIAEIDRGLLFTKFTINSIRHITEMEVPFYTFQAVCNHQLYGPRCKVAREDYTVEVTLGDSWVFWDFDRRIVSAEMGAKPEFWYLGGVMAWVDPDGKEWKAQIITVRTDANYFYIKDPDSIPGFGPPTGKVVTLTAGCDRRFRTCHDKFDNTRNFGGFPYMKTRDPQRGII